MLPIPLCISAAPDRAVSFVGLPATPCCARMHRTCLLDSSTFLGCRRCLLLSCFPGSTLGQVLLVALTLRGPTRSCSHRAPQQHDVGAWMHGHDCMGPIMTKSWTGDFCMVSVSCMPCMAIAMVPRVRAAAVPHVVALKKPWRMQTMYMR